MSTKIFEYYTALATETLMAVRHIEDDRTAVIVIREAFINAHVKAVEDLLDRVDRRRGEAVAAPATATIDTQE